MRKQAFLILAHDEYEVLQELVSALDKKENDIYVHIDKKVHVLPILKTRYSQVIMLNERKNVYWGCLEVVEAETALFECAYHSGFNYEFFHLISGTHYPLVSIEKLQEYFDSVKGNNVVQSIGDSQIAASKRMGRYHLFLKYYYSTNKIKKALFKLQWLVGIRLQEILGIKRDISHLAGKTSNWCSLTTEGVKAWLSEKEMIRKKFRWTFCSDEYVTLFVLKKNNLPVVFCNNMLLQEFCDGRTKAYTITDFDTLKASGAFYVRKITKDGLSLIKKIKNSNN